MHGGALPVTSHKFPLGDVGTPAALAVASSIA